MLEKLIQFFPNTKAKSSEVNYNFDLIKESVDELNEWKTEIDTKVTSNLGFNLFDTKVTDHLLTGDAARGWMLQGSLVTKTYISAVDAIKSYYENGVTTTYRGITCKRATNKMYIADIGQKAAIDKLFNSTGVAEFYIVDRLNDQFYLPRTKWFHQFTLDTSVVNNYTEAGLPNHQHSPIYLTGSNADLGDPGQCYMTNNSQQNGVQTSKSSRTGNVSNNSIYGKSSTVQPTSSFKLLYYKVGDTYTNIDNMLIDATDYLNEKIQELEETGEQAVQNVQTKETTSLAEMEEAKDEMLAAIQAQGTESAQLSKDWAIKMDGKVNNEDYSSKYYADLAKDVIPAGGLQDEVLAKQSDADYDYKWTSIEGGLGANKDLSNLNSEGEKHFVNKSQITNCLLSIPQLVPEPVVADNTLTFSQGLTVIVPYGKSAPTLEVGGSLNGGEIVDISWDGQNLFYLVKYGAKTYTKNKTSGSDEYVLMNAAGALSGLPFDFAFSSATAPAVTEQHAIWYDSANNIVKWSADTGSSWINYYSLPVAAISFSGSGTSYDISGVKTLYNGTKFIDSAVFIDKGIKILIPSGRNPDGTLKNTEYEFTNVDVWDMTDDITGEYWVQAGVDNFVGRMQKTWWKYDFVNNYIVGGNGEIARSAMVGEFSISSGKITSFKPYNTFHAVDYNEANNKANCDFSNVTKPYVKQSYINGTSWYRLWSDGWCEQGSFFGTSSSGLGTVTLLKKYANTSYSIMVTGVQDTNKSGNLSTWTIKSATPKTGNSFTIIGSVAAKLGCCWLTAGYLAEGEY